MSDQGCVVMSLAGGSSEPSSWLDQEENAVIRPRSAPPQLANRMWILSRRIASKSLVLDFPYHNIMEPFVSGSPSSITQVMDGQSGPVSRWSRSTETRNITERNDGLLLTDDEFVSEPFAEANRIEFGQRLMALGLRGPEAIVCSNMQPVNLSDEMIQGKCSQESNIMTVTVRQVSLRQLRRETMFIDGALVSPLNMVVSESEEALLAANEDNSWLEDLEQNLQEQFDEKNRDSVPQNHDNDIDIINYEDDVHDHTTVTSNDAASNNGNKSSKKRRTTNISINVRKNSSRVEKISNRVKKFLLEPKDRMRAFFVKKPGSNGKMSILDDCFDELCFPFAFSW